MVVVRQIGPYFLCMFIEINISTCVFLPHSGGGLRTGASCSWDLEKICNWFAVKGPFETLSLAEPALLGDGGDKGRTYRLSVLEPLLRVPLTLMVVTGTLFFPYVSDTELQSSTLVHLIEVSRRALTVGRDRIMQLHKESRQSREA
ncbi:hypothetical protein Bca101_052227 [Brassica carinata]